MLNGIVNIDDCGQDDTFWFMSYVIVSVDQKKVTYGSCVYSGVEKPWQRVARWNKENDYQTVVLLGFQLCKGYVPKGKYDCEAGFFTT